jgi:hypothetical protein
MRTFTKDLILCSNLIERHYWSDRNLNGWQMKHTDISCCVFNIHTKNSCKKHNSVSEVRTEILK